MYPRMPLVTRHKRLYCLFQQGEESIAVLENVSQGATA
jgi:hypothetical protein